MATSIHLTRRTYATNLITLQDDTDLWDLGQELRSLFDSVAMPLITGSDVHEALSTRHPDATLVEEGYTYEWLWNPIREEWEKVCTRVDTVTVPASPEPMLVRVHQRATYAP